MKKCVIIGSGLAGLSCGCILSRNGYEVTVLEQGAQTGGCLQCFSRGGTIFDTGMHYIGSADSGQTLNIMLRYLGIEDEVKLQRLDPMGYDVISFRGEHYRLANGRENFINALAEKFPDSREELGRYYDLIKTVVATSAMHSLDRNANLNLNAEYQIRSVNEVIDSVISDPLLREVLAGTLPLYAGEKNRTPFTTHALITDFYDQSTFRMVGGSSVMADAMEKQIRSRGGKVLTHHKVCRIECDEEKATAVLTSNGERFDADLVVSTIHPANTMDLTDSHLLRRAYRMRVKNSRNTTGAFTVYLKFRKDRVRYMNSNLYYYRSGSTWDCEKYDQLSWPECLLYMHVCHKENPEFAEAGEIIAYMNFEETSKWQGTKIGRRGEDYEAFKREKAEALICALEEEIPGIRDDIESYYTSTPLTYKDYTGVQDGAMYGIAKDVNELGVGSVSCRTGIPNLILAGQSITLHGMLGVLAGSFVSCAEVLTIDEVFAQLKEIKEGR